MPRRSANDPLDSMIPVSIRDRRPSGGPKRTNNIKPTEETERIGARLSIQLRLRNRDRCHAIIDAYLDGDAPTEADVKDTPMAEIVSVRIANALETIKVYTLGQALQLDRERLLELPNFGPAMVEELKTVANRLLGRVA